MNTVNKKLKVIVILLSMILSLNASDDFDESLEDLLNMESELKADVGSRSGAANFLDSPVPVDVITSTQIENSGLTSLTDVMRYFVAGFNAPETSVADGSDHSRAFTLRGMSPDQVLVLVNSKRLHSSSLLHVNGTIGRGSSGVDLDTIVLNSIEKIEILRDGAAAQYGSDAIAGVINIILKGVGHKDSISIHGGMRSRNDGEKLQADVFVSVPLKYDGFINFSLAATQQEDTQRAGEDLRLTSPSVKTHVGIPESKNIGLVLNAEVPLESGLLLYSNVLFNYRDSEASAFFRPSSTQNTPIYTNGFLPILQAENIDTSISAGLKGEMFQGVYWDLSNVYGQNDINYKVKDSMNYSLSGQSPTSFDNGGLSFIQNTTNLDLKTSFDNLDLAGGMEYRYEKYEIESGEVSSYSNGGSQGFSGYQPDNEVDSSRDSYAIYLDTTYHFTSNFSVEGAARHEKFSDFGSTDNFKISTMYKIIPELLFRSSVSTGFRAPSLAQSNYSHTSSFGGLTEGTFKPDHAVSQAFGAEELKPEESEHFALGAVYQPTNKISFMVDYYYINVDDRIMLSDDLVGVTPNQIAVMSAHGVSKARFFTNAVDTSTQGVDIKANFKHDFDNSDKLDIGIWYNYNKNEVKSYNTKIVTEANSFEQIDRLENGQPKDSIRLIVNYEVEKLITTLNLSRYGKYKQVYNNVAYKFDAAYITDLNMAYNFTTDFKIAIGANNLFDVTPNKWDGLSATSGAPFYGSNGIKPYSRYSPFGYSGAYYYTNLSLKF